MVSHKMLGLVLAGTILAAGPAWAQDCKAAHTFKTLADGKITATIYEYPPFSSATADGKIGGVDSAILQGFAAAECKTLVPLVVDPAATIQYVISGKADIAGGDWYRTEKRAQVMGLSYPTYLDQMGLFSKTGVTKVEQLLGHTVGTVSGFLWVAELQKLLGSNLHLYPNPVALAQDLEAGRVDMGVDSYGTGVYAQKRGGYKGIKITVAEPDQRVQASIQPAQATLLYTKSNAELGKALDDYIEGLHKSGKLAEILKANDLDPSGAAVGEPRLIK